MPDMDNTMKLRKLQARDASFMLEWMHDNNVVQYLRGDFPSKSLDDCIRFITEAHKETENIHLAIVNDQDDYMGTVSLKNIHKSTAELAIVSRTCAMGKGYATFAMKEILEYGYKEKGITAIYWCVDPRNQRAIRFYEKQRYKRSDAPEQAFGYNKEEMQKYIWYCTERRR